VPRGGPAWDAGLSPDDEILAINGYRVRPEQWNQRMEQYRPGEEVSMLLCRSGQIITLPLRLGQEPMRWILEADPEATSEQQQRFRKWVYGTGAGAGK